MRLVLLAAVCAVTAAFEASALRSLPHTQAHSPAASAAAASPRLATRLADVLSPRRRISTIQAVALEGVAKAQREADDLTERMWSYVRSRGGDRLIRRILIANNGMASTKTIMSIRNW